MKTTEQRKQYRHDYYIAHKEYHAKEYRKWCKANPARRSATQKQWRAKNPTYYRDYMRKRKAVTEPLIFQFLDNGFEGDVDGFVAYLRNNGVPEQHIKWFKTDVRNYLRKKR